MTIDVLRVLLIKSMKPMKHTKEDFWSNYLDSEKADSDRNESGDESETTRFCSVLEAVEEILDTLKSDEKTPVDRKSDGYKGNDYSDNYSADIDSDDEVIASLLRLGLVQEQVLNFFGKQTLFVAVEYKGKVIGTTAGISAAIKGAPRDTLLSAKVECYQDLLVRLEEIDALSE